MTKVLCRMKKFIILVLVLLCTSCLKKDDRHFWYPILLVHVDCGSSFSRDVYVMTNSVGWRSNPFVIDASDKKEISIGDNCVSKHIRNLPVHKSTKTLSIEDQLTVEQKEYMIVGF
jgi:hypothetical protein